MLENMLKIGVLPMNDANRLKSLMKQEGIDIETLHNQATCNKGCSITMEVWVPKEGLMVLEKIWHQDQRRNFSGLEFDPQVVNQVFDTNKDSAVCPACGTSFSTSLSECPECGLCF